MAMRIRGGDNYSMGEAIQAVHGALKYLRQSKLASEIIDDLESIDEILTIVVGPGQNDRYEHPPVADGSAMIGTVYWDPGLSIGVVDKVARPGDTGLKPRRPNVPWVKQQREKRTIWNCCGARAPVDHHGEINPKVALMHELGHVYQFLSNPAEFRAFFRNADGSKKGVGEMAAGKQVIEQINTAAIEQPVILELREAGYDLGIRWDYYDTV